MPKRKKLTDADVKKVESVILSDTDVEKADRSKYGVARRSIWYILRFVLIASVVVTLCYAALYGGNVCQQYIYYCDRRNGDARRLHSREQIKSRVDRAFYRKLASGR